MEYVKVIVILVLVIMMDWIAYKCVLLDVYLDSFQIMFAIKNVTIKIVIMMEEIVHKNNQMVQHVQKVVIENKFLMEFVIKIVYMIEKIVETIKVENVHLDVKIK